MRTEVTFKTDFFKPEPGEEEKTFPGRFGQALADWLQEQLHQRGVPTEGLIPEEFGWIVSVSRKPVSLWLGCCNAQGSTTEWRVFSVAELPLLERIFGRADPEPVFYDMYRHIHAIVPTIPSVKEITWQ